MNVPDANAEGQPQDRDCAPSHLLRRWCTNAITGASSGRIHNVHLALLWAPANNVESRGGCWTAGVKLQAGETSVVTFQGNGGKHNYDPWQKLRCWRGSSPKQRGSCRKEQPLPCWEGLFLVSDMQKDAHPTSRVGEHKRRVPCGSELPDVSSVWWQDLPTMAWPVFPLHEKCSWDKLLLIMPPGRLWEAQQAVSGRGGTCPASPRSPGNWKLHVLSADLEGLVSLVIPSAASSPRMTEKASFCVLRWTEIKALKKSPSHAVLTQRLTGDSDETAWISALCKPGALPQLTDLTDFQDALALRSPNT